MVSANIIPCVCPGPSAYNKATRGNEPSSIKGTDRCTLVPTRQEERTDEQSSLEQEKSLAPFPFPFSLFLVGRAETKLGRPFVLQPRSPGRVGARLRVFGCLARVWHMFVWTKGRVVTCRATPPNLRPGRSWTLNKAADRKYIL